MNIREEQARRFKSAVEQVYGTYAEMKRDMDAHGYEWPYSRLSNYGNADWGRCFGPEEAVTLGRFLGCSAAYLLCIDEETTLEQDEEALLSSYRKADRSGRAAILTTARQIAGYSPDRHPVPNRPETR